MQRDFPNLPRIHVMRPRAATVCAAMALCVCLTTAWTTPAFCWPKSEILRYDVTWNGQKAAHGDVTTMGDPQRVQVIVQAVADGVPKKLLELWSRVQGTFLVKPLTPEKYTFHLKSNIVPNEVVDLTFDRKTELVMVSKTKGDETETHHERFDSVYDPVTAACVLRVRRDLLKPISVDIYDGKARARLFVTPLGAEPLNVRGGSFNAVKLGLRLVKLTGDKEEIGTATLWMSEDKFRVPLLLTANPIVGTLRFELTHFQREG
jgi:hypothetical protein